MVGVCSQVRGYIDRDRARVLFETYDRVLDTLVGMINHADTWIIPSSE